MIVPRMKPPRWAAVRADLCRLVPDRLLEHAMSCLLEERDQPGNRIESVRIAHRTSPSRLRIPSTRYGERSTRPLERRGPVPRSPHESSVHSAHYSTWRPVGWRPQTGPADRECPPPCLRKEYD